MIEAEQTTLEWQKFYATQSLSPDFLSGLHRVEFREAQDMMFNRLTWSLTAAVLKEDAGEPVTASDERSVSVALPERPWWLPKFAWRRIPCGVATWTLSASVEAQPLWTYPRSNVRVPELQTPVRFLTQRQDVQWNGEAPR